FALGTQPSLPDRPEKIDLQLHGGQRFIGSQRGCKRDSHGRVRNVTKNAAIQRSHGVCVLPPRRERQDRASFPDLFCFESDQPRDGNIVALHAGHEVSLMHRFRCHPLSFMSMLLFVNGRLRQARHAEIIGIPEFLTITVAVRSTNRYFAGAATGPPTDLLYSATSDGEQMNSSGSKSSGKRWST